MSDSNALKMAAPSTVFMCESLTILEFVFSRFQDIETFNIGIIRNELTFLDFIDV